MKNVTGFREVRNGDWRQTQWIPLGKTRTRPKRHKSTLLGLGKYIDPTISWDW